jgi:hypothetical protein
MTDQEKDTRAVALASVNQTAGETVFTNAEIRDMSHGRSPLKPEEIKPPVPEVVPPVEPALVAAEDGELLRALEQAIEDDDLSTIAQIVGIDA